MKRYCYVIGLICLSLSFPRGATSSAPVDERPLFLVSGISGDKMMARISDRCEVYWRGEDFIVGAGDIDSHGIEREEGVSIFPLANPSPLPLYLIDTPDGKLEVNEALEPLGDTVVLYADEAKGLVRVSEEAVEMLLGAGFHVVRIGEVPLPCVSYREDTMDVHPAYDPRHDPVQGLVDQVSKASLESNVQRLQDFKSRYVQSDSIWAAGEWIHDQFVSYGYTDVIFDTLDVLVYGKEHRNILATKQGTGDPSRYVIIGAHYDSYAYLNPSNNAPGADDNGSGVSAVLEIARILATEPLDATVIFASWTAEEVGLVGSGDFVERAFNSGMNIELYQNLDACGYLGDPPKDVDLLSDGPSTPYSELMMTMAGRYTTLLPEIMPNIDFSDHASFRQYGYPFTYSIEGEITPYIHTPMDLVGTIDFDYMSEIVQMNLATLVDVAGLDEHRLFISLEPGDRHVMPGDTLRFDARLVNNTGSAQNGDLWFGVQTPDSTEFLIPDLLLNLASNPLNGSLSDGQDISMGIELYLPQNVTPGGYALWGRIGNYGGVVADEDLFTVVVGGPWK